MEDTECIATSFPGFLNAVNDLAGTQAARVECMSARRPARARDHHRRPGGSGQIHRGARARPRGWAISLLDTGAMYRALAWALQRAGVAAEDGTGLRALLARTTVDLIDDDARAASNGRDVTGEIRTPAIGRADLAARPCCARCASKLTPAAAGRWPAAGGVVLEGA